jgi:hypothetical protein
VTEPQPIERERESGDRERQKQREARKKKKIQQSPTGHCTGKAGSLKGKGKSTTEPAAVQREEETGDVRSRGRVSEMRDARARAGQLEQGVRSHPAASRSRSMSVIMSDGTGTDSRGWSRSESRPTGRQQEREREHER